MRYVRGPIEETLSSVGKLAFVCGPRQVGKTTVAWGLLAKAERGYFNWDAEGHRRAILRDPERFWDAAVEPGAFMERLSFLAGRGMAAAAGARFQLGVDVARGHQSEVADLD